MLVLALVLVLLLVLLSRGRTTTVQRKGIPCQVSRHQQEQRIGQSDQGIETNTISGT